jgi:hypothetical protein
LLFKASSTRLPAARSARWQGSVGGAPDGGTEAGARYLVKHGGLLVG